MWLAPLAKKCYLQSWEGLLNKKMDTKSYNHMELKDDNDMNEQWILC